MEMKLFPVTWNFLYVRGEIKNHMRCITSYLTKIKLYKEPSRAGNNK